MVINYELAKQLKEAGFPQKETGEIAYGGSKDDGTYWEAALPTLSELIAACGDKFDCLTLHEGTWYCRDLRPIPTLVGYGATPEEAVAKLWLALNKK